MPTGVLVTLHRGWRDQDVQRMKGRFTTGFQETAQEHFYERGRQLQLDIIAATPTYDLGEGSKAVLESRGRSTEHGLTKQHWQFLKRTETDYMIVNYDVAADILLTGATEHDITAVDAPVLGFGRGELRFRKVVKHPYQPPNWNMRGVLGFDSQQARFKSLFEGWSKSFEKFLREEGIIG